MASKTNCDPRGSAEEKSRAARLSLKIGTWVFISWILILGPAGFALSGGLAYALHFSDPALGAVCALLLMSPLLFLCMWTPLFVCSILMEKKSSESTSSLTESLRSPSQYVN